MSHATDVLEELLSKSPKNKQFTPGSLKKSIGVTETQYLYALQNGTLTSNTFTKETLTENVVEKWLRAKDTHLVTTQDMAIILGVSAATVRAIAKREGIVPFSRDVKTYHGTTEWFFWTESDYDSFVSERKRRNANYSPRTTLAQWASDESLREKIVKSMESESARKAREAADAAALIIKERNERRAARKVILESEVSVTVRQRSVAGTTAEVHMHLGPTNSGKTYHALEMIVSAFRDNPQGRFVYAGPLRMLAQEVRDTLAAKVGEDNVGVLTGEEQINRDAPILCCTAEMAPRDGDLLVVDEAHWAVDDDRGRHWTELMLASTYPQTVILGPSGCEELFRAAFSDIPKDNVVVTHHKRKTPLIYVGRNNVYTESGTAIVAFSRRKVEEIVEELHNDRVTALPLYGALPLPVRKAHVAAFAAGEVDVIVTTDVIGHGINLPIKRIAFVDTVKFDGRTARELKLWEAAQIAGRAGRYGMSECGDVGFWAFYGGGKYGGPRISEQTLKQAVEVANGSRVSDVEQNARLTITPSFEALSLGSDDHEFLSEAVIVWARKAREMYSGSPLIRVSDMTSPLKNLHAIAEELKAPMCGDVADYGDKPWNADIKDVWGLACGPFDPRDIALSSAAKWLNTGNLKHIRDGYAQARDAKGWTFKESLEKQSREIAAFQSLGVMFSDDGSLPCGITAEQMTKDAKLVSDELEILFKEELEHARRPVPPPKQRKKKYA